MYSPCGKLWSLEGIYIGPVLERDDGRIDGHTAGLQPLIKILQCLRVNLAKTQQIVKA